jgi:hypothetical protein
MDNIQESYYFNNTPSSQPTDFNAWLFINESVHCILPRRLVRQETKNGAVWWLPSSNFNSTICAAENRLALVYVAIARLCKPTLIMHLKFRSLSAFI